MTGEKGGNRSILVVGGGISGLTTAVEAAEVGYDVYIVEKNPYLGGRVARLHQYFPKLCPPSCGLEINFRRIKESPRIRFFTMAEVEQISGQEGDFDVTIKLNPRYVNEKCTCCGDCAEACTTEIPNEFNYDMDKVKAAYLPHNFAFPMRYVISPEIVGTDEGKKCAEACKYNAVELDMQPKSFNLKVGSIVWATGWQPYDAAKIDYYRFGEYPNVITNVMMERLASPDGPTQGKILCPSDGKEVESVAFVQCAGSRDETHLWYCSGICCLASLKQATYVREKNPSSKVYIFYIDIRAYGTRFEDFYNKVRSDENISLIKGKVATILENPETKAITVGAEDQLKGEEVKIDVDLVVLATGMVPNTLESKIPADVSQDDYGFVVSGVPGIYAAGCVRKPVDVVTSVQDGTAAALKAIQSCVRR